MRLVLVLVACLVCLNAEVVRSKKALHDFKVQTGFPGGRPGWVIDHVIPLCSCLHDPACLSVLDTPANMQWQDSATAKQKDVREKLVCRTITRVRGASTPDSQNKPLPEETATRKQ
jgi:hypothetical protein